ncbi:MAG: radical SAM protein [Candidatus Bathyarchaeia archaeon]
MFPVIIDRLKAPLSIHLLITSRCNLHCKECFYRHEKAEIPFSKIKNLFREWKFHGVRSVALGGGEPLIHPQIEDIVELGERMGFYMAITTNGTILKDIRPDRLHISYDEIHPVSRESVERAIRYYRRRARKIGINHIVRNIKGVLDLKDLDVDTIALLAEKPKSSFKNWKALFKLKLSKQVWFDACLSRFFSHVKCRQGVTSMSINPSLEASACSNIRHQIPYTSLTETWGKVRSSVLTRNCRL